MKGKLDDALYQSVNAAFSSIFAEAAHRGINFIVYGGFSDGRVDLDKSDVDVLCESRQDLTLLQQIAVETLSNNHKFQIVDIRTTDSGFHIIFRIHHFLLMLDAVTRFAVEQIVYVDGTVAFALKHAGVEVENLLKKIKQLSNAKQVWPRVPDTLYCLLEKRVSWRDRLWAWLRKGFRLAVGYVRARRGVMVVLLGLDGSGKSSIIDEIKKQWFGKRTLIPVLSFHWMPEITFSRPKPSYSASATNPHSKPPRTTAGSYVKILYLLIGFWLGYLTSVRPLLVRNGVVIGDRYYHDLLVDPRRYRYGGPMRLARLVARFVPKPDLFIFLDLPAEVAHARKPEVPIKEAQKLRDQYLKLARNLPNTYVVDASRSLEEVAAEVQEIILGYMSRPTVRRLGAWIR